MAHNTKQVATRDEESRTGLAPAVLLQAGYLLFVMLLKIRSLQLLGPARKASSHEIHYHHRGNLAAPPAMGQRDAPQQGSDILQVLSIRDVDGRRRLATNSADRPYGEVAAHQAFAHELRARCKQVTHGDNRRESLLPASPRRTSLRQEV